MKSWPNDTQKIVKDLNENLNKNIRAAELISSALCQLIIGNNTKDSIAYLEESIKWLKGINTDTPCPDRKSPL